MTHLMIKLLLAGISALGIAAAAMTISPSSHDFGKVGVLGISMTQAFVTTLPQGTARPTVLMFSIEGPGAVDFNHGNDLHPVDPFASTGLCSLDPQGVARCEETVEFRPRSLGRKSAILVVTDNHGNRATAALSGTGVAPLCTHTVIPCNYAIHYSGVFSWQGGGEQVTVDVLQGMAACNGTAPEGGRIQGPGLIGVEFGPVSSFSSFYRITVACPSPAFPARDGYPATPSEPAELGHGEQSSDKQPLIMTLQQLQERLPSLKHSISYPAGDAAAGTFTVSWDLCPNGLTIPTVGGQARCSPPGPP